MKKTGRWLERLVASVEASLIDDSSAKIESNIRKYGAKGQVAEFDIIISLSVGAIPVRILIECRDRKAKANSQWMESLIGRRLVHGFTKVCAVSTSGFSSGCAEIASKFDIECKTVKSIDSGCVLGILAEVEMPFIYLIKKPEGHEIRAEVFLCKEYSDEDRERAGVFLRSIPSVSFPSRGTG